MKIALFLFGLLNGISLRAFSKRGNSRLSPKSRFFLKNKQKSLLNSATPMDTFEINDILDIKGFSLICNYNY